MKQSQERRRLLHSEGNALTQPVALHQGGNRRCRDVAAADTVCRHICLELCTGARTTGESPENEWPLKPLKPCSRERREVPSETEPPPRSSEERRGAGDRGTSNDARRLGDCGAARGEMWPRGDMDSGELAERGVSAALPRCPRGDIDSGPPDGGRDAVPVLILPRPPGCKHVVKYAQVEVRSALASSWKVWLHPVCNLMCTSTPKTLLAGRPNASRNQDHHTQDLHAAPTHPGAGHGVQVARHAFGQIR